MTYHGKGWGEDALRHDIIRLAKRYGYRKIAQLFRPSGWTVSHKKIERIWREGGCSCRSAMNANVACIIKIAP
ncbi:MAG TPA: hypothetical protein DEQ69_11710 [Rhodobacteraceae bacterium]|nr:hypothetical protein [Paracoccaceae bacterium]